LIFLIPAPDQDDAEAASSLNASVAKFFKSTSSSVGRAGLVYVMVAPAPSLIVGQQLPKAVHLIGDAT